MKINIIGAGLAGCTCAALLKEKNKTALPQKRWQAPKPVRHPCCQRYFAIILSNMDNRTLITAAPPSTQIASSDVLALEARGQALGKLVRLLSIADLQRVHIPESVMKAYQEVRY